MSKRHYKQQTSEPAIAGSPSTLPTQEPVAVYYRQSTDAQVGNVSTTIQTVDRVAYLKQRGWSDEQVIMMDMDAGISGTTKIDERPGMKALFQLITEGKIRAVACQDEDRLFRDVTQIQVNIFIEACKQAHVMVLTPSMVYDFAHEQMGTFHARQFRFKCEMAAEYIDSYQIRAYTTGMPPFIKLEAHLTTEELERRYREEKDGVGRSHWQILWLLSSGKRTGEIAQVTGYSVPWIRNLTHRYNAAGPDAVGDRRPHNGGHGRLLTSEQAGELKAELERAQVEGQAWNGPQVAAWMSAKLGRMLNKARGWDMLQRLGYTSKTPRPRHAKADMQTQHDFKKTSA